MSLEGPTIDAQSQAAEMIEPAAEAAKQIIDQVPGAAVASQPESGSNPSLITSADVPGGSGELELPPSPIDKTVSNVDFKGDPRRVPGHPSNPLTQPEASGASTDPADTL